MSNTEAQRKESSTGVYMHRRVWHLTVESETIERYCANCGRKVIFTFSGQIRRNANGKTIHSFKIYKCPKDHTWNRRFESGSHQGSAANGDTAIHVTRDVIDLHPLQFTNDIEIITPVVTGVWRLDKTLTDRLDGLSRECVKKLIDKGCVIVNGAMVKGRYRLKSGDLIRLRMGE